MDTKKTVEPAGRKDNQNVPLMATSEEQSVDGMNYCEKSIRGVDFKFIEDIGWPKVNSQVDDNEYKSEAANGFMVWDTTGQEAGLRNGEGYKQKSKNFSELATVGSLGNGALSTLADDRDCTEADIEMGNQTHVSKTVLIDAKSWAQEPRTTNGFSAGTNNDKAMTNVMVDDPRRAERRENLSKLIGIVSERGALSGKYTEPTGTNSSSWRTVKHNCGIM